MSSPAAKYRLGRLIGGGGMAEVFEATAHGAEGFARPVAVKRMLPALSLDPAFGQMFVNEARIASLLHHQNVVSVLDFDRDAEGRHFLVMELVRGVDLRKLAASGPLPLSVIAYVATEVLAGLSYAHELEQDGRPLGIVHRDVSPHNVMVSWDGAVKLVDFGIAKAVSATGASRSGGLKGKLAYMSPEQAHGLVLDGRADVFAVGVMCHELVTGDRLFPGQTEAEVLARVLTQAVPWPRQSRPDVPADFEAVVMRMLERDRNARFPTAAAAHAALLSTSVVDPRAPLLLRDLLRQRFADSPRRRGDSEPASTPTSSGSMPIADSGTVPQGRAARALMSEKTRTATPVTSTLKVGRSRAWLAIGAVAVAAVGAAVALVATRGRSPAASTTEPATESVTATEPATATEPVTATVPDAAAAPEAAADAAPADRSPPRRRDAAAAAEPRKPGHLSIRVVPWATIQVDGVDAGETPKTLTLPAGPHEIRLQNLELGRTETRTVTIEPGKTEDIRLRWSD